jgi:hypothetical protein
MGSTPGVGETKSAEPRIFKGRLRQAISAAKKTWRGDGNFDMRYSSALWNRAFLNYFGEMPNDPDIAQERYDPRWDAFLKVGMKLFPPPKLASSRRSR